MRKILDEKVLQMTYNLVVTLRDSTTGKIKKQDTYHNIITTAGKTAIANALWDSTPSPTTLYVNYIALGTGTNTPAVGDTTLQTETYRNNVVSGSNISNVVTISGFFSTTETSGTFREAGLFIAGTASANTGTLLSHVAMNVTKATTETLTLDWTITIS